MAPTSSPRRKIAAPASDGRFQAAPIVAAHEYAFQGTNRALTPRDVKNEDRSDYVYENTGETDIMSSYKRLLT
jgi:hypothetical protein